MKAARAERARKTAKSGTRRRVVGGKRALLAEGEISTGAAARIVGMNPQTLRRWVERGAMKPSKYGDWRGAMYGWTVPDLVAARAIRNLRERASAQHVRKVVRALNRYGEDLASAVLTVDNRGVYRVLPSGDLLHVLTGQLRAVALAPIVEDLRAQVGLELKRRESATG